MKKSKMKKGGQIGNQNSIKKQYAPKTAKTKKLNYLHVLNYFISKLKSLGCNYQFTIDYDILSELKEKLQVINKQYTAENIKITTLQAATKQLKNNKIDYLDFIRNFAHYTN